MISVLSRTLIISLTVAAASALFAGEPSSVHRTIAITFDDLPAVRVQDTKNMQSVIIKILTVITKHKIPATGFVNESRLYSGDAPDPERVKLLQLWLDAGLELGNHTYSHPDLHRVTADEYEADILRGEIITRPLAKESGKTLEYFRHPFLHTGMTPETKKEITDFLAEHGYRIAPVTVDNSEWIFNVAYINANGNQRHAIASEYLTYMELTLGYYDSRSQILFDRKIPQILLLHSNSINADYLEDLVTMMTRRGYRFVSLQEALKDPAYELPDTFTGREGISWIQRWALAKGVPGSFFVDEPPTPKWIQDLAGIRE